MGPARSAGSTIDKCSVSGRNRSVHWFRLTLATNGFWYWDWPSLLTCEPLNLTYAKSLPFPTLSNRLRPLASKSKFSKKCSRQKANLWSVELPQSDLQLQNSLLHAPLRRTFFSDFLYFENMRFTTLFFVTMGTRKMKIIFVTDLESLKAFTKILSKSWKRHFRILQ